MEPLKIGKRLKYSVGTSRTATEIKRKGRHKPDAVIYAEKLAKTVKEIDKKVKVRVYTDKNGNTYPVITYIYCWKKDLKDPIIKLRMTPLYLRNIENS